MNHTVSTELRSAATAIKKKDGKKGKSVVTTFSFFLSSALLNLLSLFLTWIFSLFVFVFYLIVALYYHELLLILKVCGYTFFYIDRFTI